MNRHTALFGQYVPTGSVIHRLPTWAKYLLMFLGGLAPFLVRNLWFTIAVGLGVIALLLLARISWRTALKLPLAFWVMIALLGTYYVVFGDWRQGLVYVLNFICAMYASRLVTMTTTTSALMDAIVAGTRPLRFVGLNPERVALALALMWRSIPYLLGSISDVRDAARARGIERSLWRFVVPVVVGAVGYALTTGDAVKARGLDDRDGH